jgi:hypothetical protein
MRSLNPAWRVEDFHAASPGSPKSARASACSI